MGQTTTERGRDPQLGNLLFFYKGKEDQTIGFNLTWYLRVVEGRARRRDADGRHVELDEDVREGPRRHLLHFDEEALAAAVQVVLLLDLPHDGGGQQQRQEARRERDEELLQFQLQRVLRERYLDTAEPIDAVKNASQ